MSLLLVLSLTGLICFPQIIWSEDPAALGDNKVGDYKARFDLLKEILPSHGVVGFTSISCGPVEDKEKFYRPMEVSWKEQRILEIFQAQKGNTIAALYALAPRILLPVMLGKPMEIFSLEDGSGEPVELECRELFFPGIRKNFSIIPDSGYIVALFHAEDQRLDAAAFEQIKERFLDFVLDLKLPDPDQSLRMVRDFGNQVVLLQVERRR